jgi:hypothetical protein
VKRNEKASDNKYKDKEKAPSSESYLLVTFDLNYVHTACHIPRASIIINHWWVENVL